jgi:hypothetical protein
VAELRAVIIDLFVAHSVYVFHVLPPLIGLAVSLNFLVKAFLSQIFNQNVLALNVGALVVHSAVPTI